MVLWLLLHRLLRLSLLVRMLLHRRLLLLIRWGLQHRLRLLIR